MLNSIDFKFKKRTQPALCLSIFTIFTIFTIFFGTATTAAFAGSGARSGAGQYPLRPESALYELVNRQPASISMLDFLADNSVKVTLKDESRFQVSLIDRADQQDLRHAAAVAHVPYESPAPSSDFETMFYMLLAFIVVTIVVFVAGRIRANKQVRTDSGGTSSGGMSSGSAHMPTSTITHSKHSEFEINAPVVKFTDVIGQEEAKRKLTGIVRYLKEAQKLKSFGGKAPKGYLLYGEPGEGKTLLARAVAGEAGVPFLSINGSDFVEVFVGVGATRVGALFASARAKKSPVIIFIDEIDAIGQKRSSESGGQESRQTLLKLLSEMDGFKTDPIPIVVIAATNSANSLDPALLRRFGRKVKLPAPKFADLVKLFAHYSKDLALDPQIDLEQCARLSAGLSASAVANICNEAALHLFELEERAEMITQEMMEQAVLAEHRQHVSDSKAKRFVASDQSIKLADVIGQENAKDDVQDIINFLRNPAAFTSRGAQVPRGTLMVGPPGEGKTRLAQSIAGEAAVPFLSISGSDFVEMYVGVGAARVRELFEQARNAAPCIVFIDEIDAVGKKRSGSDSNDEREQTLNQLLVEMDGFDSHSEPVIVLAATNRADVLDAALLRPGRFDRQAHFYKPDVADRLRLFHYYAKNLKLAEDVDLNAFAHNTAGFSAASIAQVCNEANLLAIRAGEESISALRLDEGIMRATIGVARKSRIMSPAEKENVAWHEVGHGVVYDKLSGGTRIARITIMPNGDSGGHVQTLNDDHFFYTEEELLTQITMALAGRAAQQIALQTTDTGAQSDFMQAYGIAYRMVTEFGMSPLGPLPALEGITRSSEQTAKIEEAVGLIVSECDVRARKIITETYQRCEYVVSVLLEKETILGEEFHQLLSGQTSRPETKETEPAAALAC